MAKVIDGLITAVSRTRFNGFTATSRNMRTFTVLFLILAALWCFTMTKSSIPSNYFAARDVDDTDASGFTADIDTSTTAIKRLNDSIADTKTTTTNSAILPDTDGEASTTTTISESASDDVLLHDTPTFVISCGTQVTDAVGEMKPLLTSMLAFSSGPLRLVFLTDSAGSARVDALFSEGEEGLGRYKRRLEVKVVVVPDKLIENFAYHVKVDPYGDRTGRWAIAKLMVPWLLPEYNRVVVVDTDMIFMDDPLELWKEHAADDRRWVYRMPLNARHSNNDICSCIVLFNLKRARNLNVYPVMFRNALAKTDEIAWYSKRKRLWQPDHGDQGMYWILMKAYPALFSALPQRWNREKCHNYSWLFKEGSKVDVGIFHRNCGGTDSRSFKDDANTQFDFFLHFKWHWLRTKAPAGYAVRVLHGAAPVMPTG